MWAPRHLIQKVEDGAQKRVFQRSYWMLELQAPRLHFENHKSKWLLDLSDSHELLPPPSLLVEFDRELCQLEALWYPGSPLRTPSPLPTSRQHTELTSKASAPGGASVKPRRCS